MMLRLAWDGCRRRPQRAHALLPSSLLHQSFLRSSRCSHLATRWVLFFFPEPSLSL